MEFFKVAVNFFRDGGFFLYPLALIFVVGVAISIERWFYLSKETVKNRALWDEITPLLQQGNFRQALQVAQGSDAQVATVLKYGIARIQHARRREDIEKAMEDAAAADEIFRVLMGDHVEPRREFIEKHALDVKELDV